MPLIRVAPPRHAYHKERQSPCRTSGVCDVDRKHLGRNGSGRRTSCSDRWRHKSFLPPFFPADDMLREFTDDDGTTWRVWDVNPSLHDRLSPTAQKISLRVPSGWLCFECERERRRLHPIPEQWETIDTAILKRMCAAAEPVRGRE
jgi:hypothetical protein